LGKVEADLSWLRIEREEERRAQRNVFECEDADANRGYAERATRTDAARCDSECRRITKAVGWDDLAQVVHELERATELDRLWARMQLHSNVWLCTAARAEVQLVEPHDNETK